MNTHTNTAENNVRFNTGVTQVKGPDAHEFLQRLISADIADIKKGDSFKSLLLDPTGKTISAFWVIKIDEECFYLLSEPYVLPRTIEMLNRFCIRTDAKIENISENYFAEITNEHLKENAILVENDIYNKIGVDLYLVENNKKLPLTREEFDAFRITAGATDFEHDLREGTIAQEAGLDVTSVSFNKGCFLGQELVCRIDSRNVSPPNRFVSIKSPNSKTADSTENLTFQGEVVGSVTSQYHDSEYRYAIVKVPRKHIDTVTNPALINELFISNQNPLSISPTIGNFSC